MAPEYTGPLVVPISLAVNGTGSKFGDHGDLYPSIQSEKIIMMVKSTTAMDQGRREGARSPRLFQKGTLNKNMPTITGARTMTYPSVRGGIKASRAKYHKRYQSGFGSAFRMLGS